MRRPNFPVTCLSGKCDAPTSPLRAWAAIAGEPRNSADGDALADLVQPVVEPIDVALEVVDA